MCIRDRAKAANLIFLIGAGFLAAGAVSYTHLDVYKRQLAAPAGVTPGRDTAVKFIAFVASAKGQQIIRDYGRERFGEALYNDAAYARKYDE